MLSRREVILTQLCLIKLSYPNRVMSAAMEQLTMVMRVLGMEPVTPNEIANLLVELESSMTEIALRTFMSSRKLVQSQQQIEG